MRPKTSVLRVWIVILTDLFILLILNVDISTLFWPRHLVVFFKMWIHLCIRLIPHFHLYIEVIVMHQYILAEEFYHITKNVDSSLYIP